MKYLLLAVSLLLAVVAVAFAGPAGFPEATLVSEGYSYSNITTSDNTVVKTGAGVLAGIVVAGGTVGAVTVYDNTTCSGTTVVPTTDNVYFGQIIPAGVSVTRGICVTTSAATKLLVIYK